MNEQMLQIRNDNIAREIAGGKKPTELAEDFGVSKATIYHVLKKDRSREIIENETKKLLSLVPSITTQISEDLELSASLQRYLKDPSAVNDTQLVENKDILDYLKLSYKKQQDVMKAVGIFPSNSTNVFIQQIYNDNRKQVLSPDIFKALGGFFTNLSSSSEDFEEDYIDAEVIQNIEEEVLETNPNKELISEEDNC